VDLSSHLQLLGGDEGLQAVLPNRLVQQQAWGMIALVEQVLIEQGRHLVQYLCALAPQRAVHRLRRFQCTPVDEDGKQAKEALFLGKEQVVAPSDGLAQGLLAGRQIPWPTR
jgi:hypothetical protein